MFESAPKHLLAVQPLQPISHICPKFGLAMSNKDMDDTFSFSKIFGFASYETSFELNWQVCIRQLICKLSYDSISHTTFIPSHVKTKRECALGYRYHHFLQYLRDSNLHY